MLSKEEILVIAGTVHRLELVPVIFFAFLLLRETWFFRPATWKDTVGWFDAVRAGYLRIPGRLWWLMAGFTVSWGADELKRWFDHTTVSSFYPIVQSAFFAFGLVSRRTGTLILYLILAAAAVSIRWPSSMDSDLLLKAVAWSAMAWAGYSAWHMNTLIRWSAILTFGVGLGFWIVQLAVQATYVVMHIEAGNTRPLFTGSQFAFWAPYAAYHTAWMLGAILFCLGAASALSPAHALNQPRQLRRPLIRLGL